MNGDLWVDFGGECGRQLGGLGFGLLGDNLLANSADLAIPRFGGVGNFTD